MEKADEGSLFSQVISILKEPVRDEFSIKGALRSSIGVGLFIALFLYIFQPFGMDNLENKIPYALGYGLITFTISFLFDLLLSRLFIRDDPTWSFWKWILATMVLILFIAIGNYFFYLFMVNQFVFSLNGLFRTLYITFSVGLFPVIFIGAFRLFNNRLENNKIADTIILPKTEDSTVKQVVENTVEEQTSTIKTEEAKQEPILAEPEPIEQETTTEILFVEAMQNYVLLHYPNAQKETKRNTLSKMETELSPFNIVRCHRSFLVNIDKIVAVSGNAQGLKLQIKDSDMEVPVSRKHIPNIRKILESKA